MDRRCFIGGIMGALSRSTGRAGMCLLACLHRRGSPVSLIRSASGDAYRGQKRVFDGGQ